MCTRRARIRTREFRDQAFCAIEAREGRESAPQTAHSTVFSVIFWFGARRARTWVACARPGCHPEHATVQWTAALPSTRSGRREASRSDERREPPEPKDPARRQPGASGWHRAGSFGSLRSLRMTMRWLAQCQRRFNVEWFGTPTPHAHPARAPASAPRYLPPAPAASSCGNFART